MLLLLFSPAVLKLEETVLEFMADSSKSSLEFPPSTSNYEVCPQCTSTQTCSVLVQQPSQQQQLIRADN